MRIIIIFIAILLILQISFALTSSGFSKFGQSVTMNLAVHINDTKDDDVITTTDNYISSHDSGLVFSLVSNNAFGTRSTALTADYLLEMRQPTENNRFFLTFTQGDNQTIANRTEYSIVPRTFGNLDMLPGPFPIYLRLEYHDIDIVNRIRWEAGSRKLIIKNEGKNEKEQDKISTEMIE